MRQDLSEWKFFLAFLVSTLALTILSFRVVGQTCSRKDNYKKLPVKAKEHENKK